MERRLACVEKQLVLLGAIIIEPELPDGVPPGMKRKTIRGTKAQALKARVGRAAKRNGMSVADWRAKYGERTTNP